MTASLPLSLAGRERAARRRALRLRNEIQERLQSALPTPFSEQRFAYGECYGFDMQYDIFIWNCSLRTRVLQTNTYDLLHRKDYVAPQFGVFLEFGVDPNFCWWPGYRDAQGSDRFFTDILSQVQNETRCANDNDDEFQRTRGVVLRAVEGPILARMKEFATLEDWIAPLHAIEAGRAHPYAHLWSGRDGSIRSMPAAYLHLLAGELEAAERYADIFEKEIREGHAKSSQHRRLVDEPDWQVDNLRDAIRRARAGEFRERPVHNMFPEQAEAG